MPLSLSILTGLFFCREFVDMEMRNVLEQCPLETHPYIIHVLNSASLMDVVPLQKATRLCLNRPVIVVSYTEGNIRARCCVPKNLVSPNFNAEEWLQVFVDVFNGQIAAPQMGQQLSEVAVMKSKRVNMAVYEEQIQEAVRKADKYAEQYFME